MSSTRGRGGSRTATTEVFAEEFEQALHVLAVLPGAGVPYTPAGIRGLRRIYLGKIGCHIYYTFDEADVVVRALWGARRGRGPFDRSSV
jgi:hypothetical protein